MSYVEDKLEIGDVLYTISNEEVKLVSLLSDQGGQGNVYKVLHRGQEKALKWYKNIINPQAFYENLKNNIKKGAPADNFLWMQELTQWQNDSFGYVMELVPEGYYELSEFLVNQVSFPSWKRAVDAALNIVRGFRLLHNRGQSYQDLNDKNFFINPKTGKVLIGDNDNVAPTGENLGIEGKERYMAPEIVRRENLPDTASDRYSLGVILFFMFCYGHPLEGRNGTPYTMTPEASLRIYGTNPVFLFDPKDASNRPVPGLQDHVAQLWECLPEYMKEIFIRAFSWGAMMEKKRVTEYEWLNALVRFRSDIVRCSCGNEIFIRDGESTACDGCGRLFEIRNRIALEDYSIPAILGSRIYQMQLGTANFEDALNPVASVLPNPDNPSDIRLKNLTKVPWKCVTPSGKQKILPPGGMAPVKKGLRFRVEDENFRIE